MKILDLGCGNGNNKYDIYNDKNETFGIDIEQENIDICKNKFNKHDFVKIDGNIIPFDDNSFDLIHSIDVLEHVDNLNNILSEATRVLKKHGAFIIEIPHWKSEERLLKIKPEYWKQVHHIRMFKNGELENLMTQYGYSLKKRKKIKFFDNMSLGFYFKKANIINQKGDMDITKKMMREFRLKYILLYIFYKITFQLLDKVYPKSIYFKFIKK